MPSLEPISLMYRRALLGLIEDVKRSRKILSSKDTAVTSGHFLEMKDEGCSMLNAAADVVCCWFAGLWPVTRNVRAHFVKRSEL
jgi:hypothetical protein